jgi:hypothetical protein
VDEISIDWKDESGQHLVKQVKKEVLTSGAWSTIMFMYQDLEKKQWTGPRTRGPLSKRGEILPSPNSIFLSRQAKQMSNIQNWLPRWVMPGLLRISQNP